MRLPYPCPVCKRLHLTKSGLCDHCSEQLFPLRAPVVRNLKGLKVKSLFSWYRDGFPALRWLVRSLKRVDDEHLWRPFATWMLAELKYSHPDVIIPIPSRSTNHALGLARAISSLTGAEVIEPLRIPSSREQKRLSRAQRQMIRFERLPSKEFTNVLIVDDIVTTGATALAAYHALNRPRNCEVWCLMDRRPCESE
jgi:predicted amidophosphoribosyltransferase